jgi:hypothetical protein
MERRFYLGNNRRHHGRMSGAYTLFWFSFLFVCIFFLLELHVGSQE